MAVTDTSLCRFVVLISGRGSNLEAIAHAIREQGLPAEILAVVSNKADAAGLAWAQRAQIATHVIAHRDFDTRQDFDEAMAAVIEAYRPDYVLLAGFMRVLTPAFVERFNGKLINIHPSLLPSFPGLHTHQQALASGVQWHGCTVHFVTPVLDSGPIIAQGVLPVLAGDTPDLLAERLLELEHRVYAAVVRWLAERRVYLDGMRRVQVQGVSSRSFVLTSHDVKSS